MRSLALTLTLLLCAAAPRPAAAAVRVVTTTEGLAALVREVGGDRVAVESLSRGAQDPHFVDANPVLAVKLRAADLLIDVGLELEIGWLPPLVNQSRNGAIQPGGARRLTAASAVQVLDVPTGAVDRSRGDLHAAGNPHFLIDPRRALAVARAIAAKLAELDPAGAASYAAGADGFATRLGAAQARWLAALGPLKGRQVYTHHRTLTYFLDWSGLKSAGELEPRPGTPPPGAHLARLVEQGKADGVKAIIVERYYDPRSAETVAKAIGATVVVIPGDVGGEPEARTYQAWIELVVNRVTAAYR